MELCRNKSGRGKAPVTGAGQVKVVPVLQEMTRDLSCSGVTVRREEGEEEMTGGVERQREGSSARDGEQRRRVDRGEKQERTGEERRVLLFSIKFLSESGQVILRAET